MQGVVRMEAEGVGAVVVEASSTCVKADFVRRDVGPYDYVDCFELDFIGRRN